MRPIFISAPIILLTLFLGGCWHGPARPPATPPIGVGSDTTTSTTEIDTSGWQTYTNEAYGFGFRYPKNYELNLSDYVSVGSGGVGSSATQAILIHGELPTSLVISVTTSSLDSIFDKTREITVFSESVGKYKERIEFPMSGVRGSDPTDIGLEEIYYYFSIGNGNYLYISYLENPITIYEKIISSLELIP